MKVQLDPVIQETLDTTTKTNVSAITIQEIRDMKAREAEKIGGPKVLEEIHQIPVRDGTRNIELIVTRPLDSEGEILPAILYLHGGGWVFGDAATYRRSRRELTVRAHAAVIFVVYSLSPEVRYPVALEECYDALEWTFLQGESILIDPSRIAVAGDSAGGNLTTALAMLDKQRGLGAVKHQVLYYPVTDSTFEQPSYQEFARGYHLDIDEMPTFWDHYVPDVKDRLSPLASPLKATTKDLENLPPALVITAEADVLRDEGEAYARKLIAAGVPTVATRYLGTIHSFLKHANLSLPAIAAFDQTAAELQKTWKRVKEH